MDGNPFGETSSGEPPDDRPTHGWRRSDLHPTSAAMRGQGTACTYKRIVGRSMPRHCNPPHGSIRLRLHRVDRRLKIGMQAGSTVEIGWQRRGQMMHRSSDPARSCVEGSLKALSGSRDRFRQRRPTPRQQAHEIATGRLSEFMRPHSANASTARPTPITKGVDHRPG